MPELRPKTQKKIPTYAADGRKLRRYSLAAIERLESLSLVVVKRSTRTNQILSANFRPQDGANPLRGTCNMGQRYSYLEHVGNERCWSHKRLIPRLDQDDSPEQADLFLRGVFRAVVLDRLR